MDLDIDRDKLLDDRSDAWFAVYGTITLVRRCKNPVMEFQSLLHQQSV